MKLWLDREDIEKKLKAAFKATGLEPVDGFEWQQKEGDSGQPPDSPSILVEVKPCTPEPIQEYIDSEVKEKNKVIRDLLDELKSQVEASEQLAQVHKSLIGLHKKMKNRPNSNTSVDTEEPEEIREPQEKTSQKLTTQQHQQYLKDQARRKKRLADLKEQRKKELEEFERTSKKSKTSLLAPNFD